MGHGRSAGFLGSAFPCQRSLGIYELISRSQPLRLKRRGGGRSTILASSSCQAVAARSWAITRGCTVHTRRLQVYISFAGRFSYRASFSLSSGPEDLFLFFSALLLSVSIFTAFIRAPGRSPESVCFTRPSRYPARDTTAQHRLTAKRYTTMSYQGHAQSPSLGGYFPRKPTHL